MSLAPLPSRLGKGPAYPFRFDEVGQVVLTSEEDEVKSCLIRLLSTEPGEDPFLFHNGVPYGVRTSQAMFRDVETARTVLAFDVRLAIEAWEPRVALISIDFTAEKSASGLGYKINCLVSYRYRTTGRADNMVVAYNATLGVHHDLARYVVP